MAIVVFLLCSGMFACGYLCGHLTHKWITHDKEVIRRIKVASRQAYIRDMEEELGIVEPKILTLSEYLKRKRKDDYE